jgi:hypothetical protein
MRLFSPPPLSFGDGALYRERKNGRVNRKSEKGIYVLL